MLYSLTHVYNIVDMYTYVLHSVTTTTAIIIVIIIDAQNDRTGDVNFDLYIYQIL